MPVPAKAQTGMAAGAGLAEVGKASAEEADLVRIAVTNAVSTSTSGQPGTRLVQLHSSTSLAALVEDLARFWKLEGAADGYGLKLEKSGEYVTERNRGEVSDGTVLKLSQSPKKLVSDLANVLRSSADPQMHLNAYNALETLSSDYALAEEMVRGGVFDTVVRTVAGSGGGEGAVGAQSLAHLVAAFYGIMRHEDLVSWEDGRIDAAFVAQVAACVETERSMRAMAQNDRGHAVCLSVLEALVCTPQKHEMVEKSVSVHSLLNFLQADSALVQRRALALFNALFRLGNRAKKRKMQQVMEERGSRKTIMECVLKKGPGQDMKNQLYVLQTLLLNLLDERMHMAVKSEDQKATEKIKELRKLVFEVREQHGSHPHQGGSGGGGGGRKFGQDYKRLGFTHEVDPTQDFRDETPPGMLALDMMYAFACHHTDQYTKLVLENSVRGDRNECPFARTSIEVVRIICDLLRIGQPPVEAGGAFFPMFFSQENPLEELFSITIQHVSKTWREMRATAEDFSKVIDVAREQITGALRVTPTTMDEYKRALKTYNEITESRKEEAKHRGEREGKAIQQLRQTITPEIMELVQRQRLNFLMRGTRFGKYKRDGGAKDRGKHVFVRLGPSQKAFHYGEWPQQADDAQQQPQDPPSVDLLPHKLPVSELRELLTGSSCPHVRDSGARGGRGGRGGERGSVEGVALSLVRETGETLDLLAPDPRAFDYWCDGVNALLRREMRSPRAAEELEMLLGMEVRIRLLDVEGIDIPDEPPPVPPLPENFDFSTEV